MSLKNQYRVYRSSGLKYFSKIDLKAAYLQIPLKSLLKIKNNLFGPYKHNLLPFDLHVSFAIFQQSPNFIAAGLVSDQYYQDNLVVHATTKEVYVPLLNCLPERFIQLSLATKIGNVFHCSSIFLSWT